MCARTLRWTAALATLLLAGCSGKKGDEGLPPISQADLAGDWDFTVFQLGAPVAGNTLPPLPGWTRGAMRVDAAGLATIVSTLNSLGYTQLPPNPAATYTVAGDGTVTATSSAYTAYRGKLSASRDLLVATATASPTGLSTLRISRKRVPGVTFSAADLAGTWRYHDLGGGKLVRWEHGTASIAADGVVSFQEEVGSDTGPVQESGTGVVSMTADGVVTVAGDASWVGFMSADKSFLVATHTAESNGYGLTLLVRGTSGRSTSEFAGTWTFHTLSNAASAATWGRGALTASAAGAVTFTDAADSSGSTSLPDPFTVAVAGDGTITQVSPEGSDFHGVVSADGTLAIGTSSRDAGTATYACSIMVSLR